MEPLSFEAWTAVAVAAVTLVGVALGRLPLVPLDRAGFALVGVAALLVTGVLDLDTAAALVDTEVLVLLFGLMLLNEALAEAGAFRALTRWAVRRAATPTQGTGVRLRAARNEKTYARTAPNSVA
jgi:Na+/H+ antiporter NhaD/arsenite permease-like protein